MSKSVDVLWSEARKAAGAMGGGRHRRHRGQYRRLPPGRPHGPPPAARRHGDLLRARAGPCPFAFHHGQHFGPAAQGHAARAPTACSGCGCRSSASILPRDRGDRCAVADDALRSTGGSAKQFSIVLVVVIGAVTEPSFCVAPRSCRSRWTSNSNQVSRRVSRRAGQHARNPKLHPGPRRKNDSASDA